MKKKILAIVLTLVCLLMLASCGCKHQWIDPNCTAPALCALCGETEGSPLGHSWLAATCSAPKICQICGDTQGEPLAHPLSEATCEKAATCTVCGATRGEPLGHSWLDATYEAPMTCEICGATQGEPLEATKTDFTQSASCATVQLLINQNMSAMSPKYEYKPDSQIFYISLTAPTGTASALASNPEAIASSWETLKTSLCDLTTSARTIFVTDGYDEVGCCIMLLNDANTDNVLLGILNGQVIYDILAQ